MGVPDHTTVDVARLDLCQSTSNRTLKIGEVIVCESHFNKKLNSEEDMKTVWNAEKTRRGGDKEGGEGWVPAVGCLARGHLSWVGTGRGITGLCGIPFSRPRPRVVVIRFHGCV